MPGSNNIFSLLAGNSTTDLLAVSSSTNPSETGQTLNSSTVNWDEIDEFETVSKKVKKTSGNKPKQVEAPKSDYHVTKIGYATKKRGGKRGGRKPKAAAAAAPSCPLPKIDFHKKQREHTPLTDK